jgi:hypothetical protein
MSTHGYWLMGIATFAFAAGRDSLQRATPEIALPALQIYAPAPVVMER